jgi:hypothetical protein
MGLVVVVLFCVKIDGFKSVKLLFAAAFVEPRYTGGLIYSGIEDSVRIVLEVCQIDGITGTCGHEDVLEHRSRGRVPLISHPYDDSSAAYLGTAILTIACFLHLLMRQPYVR